MTSRHANSTAERKNVPATSTPTISHAIRSPFLPTSTELLLLTLYPTTLILGSLFTRLSPTTRSPQTSAVYSDYHQSFQPASAAPSYFATKRNVFNVYFVKIGWFWCTLALAAFTLLAARGRAVIPKLHFHLIVPHDGSHNNASQAARATRLQDMDPTTRRTEQDARLRRRYQVLLRYVILTATWILVTQWFFGPALADRGFALTGGVCELAMDKAADSDSDTAKVLTNAACRRIGGRWQGGWDVSGHVFLLVVGSGMLWFEMLPVLFPGISGITTERVIRSMDGEDELIASASDFDVNGTNATSLNHGYNLRSPGKATSSSSIEDAAKKLQKHSGGSLTSYGTTLALGVAVLSWWMLLMTASYFHTWSEKAGGFVLASTALWIAYFMPRGVPVVREWVGMPGV